MMFVIKEIKLINRKCSSLSLFSRELYKRNRSLKFNSVDRHFANLHFFPGMANYPR